MKNEQYKIDAIQHAWTVMVGEENYQLLKHDDNGWSDWRCRGLMPSSFWDNLSSKLKQGRPTMSSGADLIYRPKSLIGLETNNGWHRIYTTFDLPKIGKVYVFLVDGREVNQWCEQGISFPKSHTHWRNVIELPKPIY